MFLYKDSDNRNLSRLLLNYIHIYYFVINKASYPDTMPLDTLPFPIQTNMSFFLAKKNTNYILSINILMPQYKK